MEILKIAGLALLGVFTAMLLKQGKGEYSTIIGLAMAMFISGYIVLNLLEVVSKMEALWAQIVGNSNFLHILLRIVGITYITDLSANICKECGYATLSGQVITAGKLGVLLSGFPIFMDLIEFVMKLGV